VREIPVHCLDESDEDPSNISQNPHLSSPLDEKIDSNNKLMITTHEQSRPRNESKDPYEGPEGFCPTALDILDRLKGGVQRAVLSGRLTTAADTQKPECVASPMEDKLGLKVDEEWNSLVHAG
jgi:hypothetical protein